MTKNLYFCLFTVFHSIISLYICYIFICKQFFLYICYHKFTKWPKQTKKVQVRTSRKNKKILFCGANFDSSLKGRRKKKVCKSVSRCSELRRGGLRRRYKQSHASSPESNMAASRAPVTSHHGGALEPTAACFCLEKQDKREATAGRERWQRTPAKRRGSSFVLSRFVLTQYIACVIDTAADNVR